MAVEGLLGGIRSVVRGLQHGLGNRTHTPPRPRPHRPVPQPRHGVNVGSAIRQVVGQAFPGAVHPHLAPHPRAPRPLPARAIPGVIAQIAHDARHAEVHQARQQIRQLLSNAAHPAKLPPLRMLDPLTPRGRALMPRQVNIDRKGIAHVTTKPFKPQHTIVYDDKSKALFEYKQPNWKNVQHNVKRLFHGNHTSQQKALSRLQRMGIVTGGVPSKKYLRYLGTATPTAGTILNEQGHPVDVKSLKVKRYVLGRGPNGPIYAPLNNPHTQYVGTDMQGHKFLGTRAQQGAPIQMRGNQPAIHLSDVVHAIGAVLHPHGTGYASQVSQEAGLPAPVVALKHGILGGEKAALGAAGEVLDRPLAAVESGVGKAFVAAHLIKGDTARKIRQARGPLAAFIKGRGKHGGVSGGDITQGLFGHRTLGIGADLLLDPIMYAGLAAAPETGGATVPLIEERLAAKLGADALKSPKLRALAHDAAHTGNSAELEQELRALAQRHGVKIPRNLGRNRQDRKVLDAIARHRTHAVVEQALRQSGTDVVKGRNFARRALNLGPKRTELRVVGKPGHEAVTNIAHSLKASRIRPGVRLKTTLPTGRDTLPLPGGRRLQLPHIDVPLPRHLPVPRLSSRPAYARERELERELQAVEAKYAQAKDQAVHPLVQAQNEARIAGDTTRHHELEQHIREITSGFDAEKSRELAKVNSAGRFKVFETLGDYTNRRNAQRLQREVGNASATFGRTIHDRYEKAVDEAVHPLSYARRTPEGVRKSLSRVQLHMWAREGTGRPGRALLNTVMPLDQHERQVVANLTRVYRDMLGHGQQLGIIDRGVKDYGGFRLWNTSERELRTPDDVRRTLDQMVSDRRFGQGASFQQHRTAPSVFDLADPRKVAHMIRENAKTPISDSEARALADQLLHAGTTRLRTELVARRLERGAPVHINELTPESQRAVRIATRLTPKGSNAEVPLFHVHPGGPEEGFVKLAPEADRHYGFTPNALENLAPHEQRVARLASAMRDRERVSGLLKGMRAQHSAEADSLRAELSRLDQEVAQHDFGVSQLPPPLRKKLIPRYGSKARQLRYTKVAPERANREAAKLLDKMGEHWRQIERHARAQAEHSPGSTEWKRHERAITRLSKRQEQLHEPILRAAEQHQIKKQIGATRLPKDLKMSTVVNDSGVLYVKGKVPPPPGFPEPRFLGEPGPFEDPLDYTHHLPDMREEGYAPILDPRTSNFYRTRAEGVVAAFKARWGAIDSVEGRSALEADGGRFVAQDGSQGRAANLQATEHDINGNPSRFMDRETGKSYAADELHYPERTLIPNGDKTVYYDPVTHQRYVRPAIGGSFIYEATPEKLWPSTVVQDAEMELLRQGESKYDTVWRTGMEGGFARAMSLTRYGVTTPFPAYHIRNLISDLLKSLQADSGVLFHPIVNAKLALAAAGKGKRLMMPIPGYGKIPIEDFLFLTDTWGLRSGHHVAEVYRLMSAGRFEDNIARHFIAHGWVNPFSPNSKLGAKLTQLGSQREDFTRFLTFMQRMRSNGGDAADAAMYMIRHHFDYNDLSAFEKRFARNTFLFYTWYRKNIPLQLTELVRRPGFFAAVAHTYRALENGETPINRDWSKINPMLPNMSGQMPESGTIPDYYIERLSAAGVNWNGHAALFGFGAPWADLQLLNTDEGLRDAAQLANPLVGMFIEMGFRKDLLTGRDLQNKEPGPLADILASVGIHVPKDKNGRPVLPFWINSLANRIPFFGRGSIGFTGVSKFRDQGLLSTLGHSLGPITGINVFVSPTGEREHAALEGIIKGRAAERGLLAQRIKNLPKTERDKQLKAFDHGTLQWAKDHHISKRLLHRVPRSGFYIGPRARDKAIKDNSLQFNNQDNSGIQLGGNKSHKKGDNTIHFGGGSSSTGRGGIKYKGASHGVSAPVTHSGGGVAFAASSGGGGGTALPVPSDQQQIIEDASHAAGIDPAVLYGVYGVETNFGRNIHNSGVGPNGGAKGPFQFEDATARSEGLRDPNNFRDAAYAAARELAKGQHGGIAGMVRVYYGAADPSYISKVKNYAAQYKQGSTSFASGTGGNDFSISGNSVQRPQVHESAAQVDEKGAILDALLNHKPGKSLLHAISARIDSGAYTTPGATTVSPGKVPKMLSSGGGSFGAGSGKVVLNPGADRRGAHTQKIVLDFLSQVAGLVGQTIHIGTGTAHDRMTVDGNVSDHWTGHAADIPVPVDSAAGDQIAAAALMSAGVSQARAQQMARRGGLFTLHFKGHRIQVIWKTNQGGNHHGHVHVGIE